jgi:hypothetical protein
VHSDLCPFILSNLVFVDPLSLYKWKDDLIALFGTLGLKTAATIIKEVILIQSRV